ncbi:MAG: hypothetical protein QOJ67_3838, partial [Acidimicrobiaceae bacterium]
PAVRTNDHRLNSNGYPGVIRDSTLKGSTGPQVVAYTEEFNNPDYYDFINNTYQGTPFTWAQDHVMPGNTWRIQDPTNGTIALHPSFEPGGVYNPTWNTTITPIAPFAQPDFTSPFNNQLPPGPVPTPQPSTTPVAPTATPPTPSVPAPWICTWLRPGTGWRTPTWGRPQPVRAW